jgi:hypothetical protein
MFLELHQWFRVEFLSSFKSCEDVACEENNNKAEVDSYDDLNDKNNCLNI